MASTETSKSIKLLNGGPLDGWWGPYVNIAAACAAIPNTEALVDGAMVNFRQGKVVGITTSEGIIKHSWNGIDFSNNGLKSDYGINYASSIVPASSNFLNPSAVVLDKYVNSAGALANADSNSIGIFAVTDFIPWGTNTQYIAGKNGIAYKLFSVAQFDVSNVFIAGSYSGLDNVTGAISKVAGAMYFRATYKIANVNQLNFGSAVLAFEAYYPSSVKKIGNADGNGNPATFNANLQDANIIAEFAKQAKTGGSTKTILDLSNEVATKGINFTITTIPASSNILNPATITLDKYVNAAGVLTDVDPSAIGQFATTDFVPWGANTQYIAGKNGVVYRLFSVAQFNASNVFIAGSYAGVDNVNGAINKVAGAVSFRASYKIANVNQINFGANIQPYDNFDTAKIKRIGDKDASDNPASFKPDMGDASLLIEFGKLTKSGGSNRTTAQLDLDITTNALAIASKISKINGVGYTESYIPTSTNILNTATSTADKYVNAAGVLTAVDSSAIGQFATTDFIPWGENTQYIAGKNGVIYRLFTVAQYNAQLAFITGSYAGVDNVNGAVTKVNNAVYFKASYKIANVNQLNFNSAIQPYQVYSPSILRKVLNKDVDGVEIFAKPDLLDVDLNARFAKDSALKALNLSDINNGVAISYSNAATFSGGLITERDAANNGLTYYREGTGNGWITSPIFIPKGANLVHLKFNVELTLVGGATGINIYVSTKTDVTGSYEIIKTITASGDYDITFDPAYYAQYKGYTQYCLWINNIASASGSSTKAKFKNLNVSEYDGAVQGTSITGLNAKDLFLSADNAIGILRSAVSSGGVAVTPGGNKFEISVQDNGAIVSIPVVPNTAKIFANSLALGWGNQYGMAASEPSKDYYNRFTDFIKTIKPSFVNAKFPAFDFEGIEDPALVDASITSLFINNLTGAEDLVVIQLGDNVNTPAKVAVFSVSCLKLLKAVRAKCPLARVVWFGIWYGTTEKYAIIQDACAKTGVRFISMASIASIPTNASALGRLTKRGTGTRTLANVTNVVANSATNITVTFTVGTTTVTSTLDVTSYSLASGTLTYSGLYQIIDNTGFASHPGDGGMRYLGNLLLYSLSITTDPEQYKTI
jgi:hypothetical protein